MGEPPQLTSAVRRRAIRLAYSNAALWSIGNGLTSGTLLYYLALDLGAAGLELSLILAMPALVGVLRLTTPAFVRLCGGAKPVCLGMSLVSYVLLWVWIADVPAPGESADREMLAALIAIVCVHQLLEYIAHAALYAWLADLVPLRVRGRFFGRRNMWQLATLIPTSLCGGYFAQWWSKSYADSDPATKLLGYTIPIACGATMLLLSLIPLWLMPGTTVRQTSPSTSMQTTRGKFNCWHAAVQPFTDRRFLPLLVYRGWFSLSNGVTQAAQNIFPRAVLGLGVGDMAILRTAMQCGQLSISPTVGRWVDRFGNRPVLQGSQALVAASLVFFLLASDHSTVTRWLILGAFILWSAYAGINVGLYNLMLKLPPKNIERSGYVACHEATGSITYAISTVAGGHLLDVLRATPSHLHALPFWLSPFAALFLLGFVMRLFGIALLARIDEPGALTWREIGRSANNSSSR